MSSHTRLDSLHLRFYAILVFICGLLPATFCQLTSLGRGGRCFDYQQRCVRDSTCAYTFLLQTGSDDCGGLEETVVKMSEVNTATQTQLERVEALERTVAEQVNRLENVTAENQRITTETNKMREELSDLKTKCSLCQNISESELEIEDPGFTFDGSSSVTMDRNSTGTATPLSELSDLTTECSSCQDEASEQGVEDPKFIFNGSSSVTMDRNSSGSASPLSEVTFCLWMKTRSGIIYDKYTALLYYKDDATVPTSRTLANSVSIFVGHVQQAHDGGGTGVSLGERIPTDGVWHHVCHVWYGPIGYGRRWIYVDGTGRSLGDGGYEFMLGGGVVYLGYAPRPFVARRSYRFIGEMSQFYMYDVKLDEQVIAGMARSCSGSNVEGALLSWPTIVNGEHYTSEHIEIHQGDICRM